MDSLLANYASDEDDEDEKPSAASNPPGKFLSLPPPKPPSYSSSLFSSSLPPPKSGSSSSSLFSSLPPPKPSSANPFSSNSRSSCLGRLGEEEDDKQSKGGIFTEGKPSSIFSSLPRLKSSSSSSFFSSLPPPKSSHKPVNPNTVEQNPRKVVQFKPPLDPSVLKKRDFDDDDDEEKRKPQRESASSVSKSLSSMLPPPKSSLGLSFSAAPASSRRSVVEADVPAVNPQGMTSEQETGGFGNYGSYDSGWAPAEDGIEGAAALGFHTSGDVSGGNAAGAEAAYYEGADYAWDPNYGGAASYHSYEGNWADGSMTTVVPNIPDMGRISGKRGRSEIHAEIVEVNQDELMKNRPRQDKAKLTGIAFGPSYQV